MLRSAAAPKGMILRQHAFMNQSDYAEIIGHGLPVIVAFGDNDKDGHDARGNVAASRGSLRQARGGQASVLYSGWGYDFDLLPDEVIWAGKGVADGELSPAFGINTLYGRMPSPEQYRAILKERFKKLVPYLQAGFVFVVPSLGANEENYDDGQERRGKGAFGHTFGLGSGVGVFTPAHAQILEEELEWLATQVDVEQKCLGSGCSFLNLDRCGGNIDSEKLKTKAQAQKELDLVRAVGAKVVLSTPDVIDYEEDVASDAADERDDDIELGGDFVDAAAVGTSAGVVSVEERAMEFDRFRREYLRVKTKGVERLNLSEINQLLGLTEKFEVRDGWLRGVLDYDEVRIKIKKLFLVVHPDKVAEVAGAAEYIAFLNRLKGFVNDDRNRSRLEVVYGKDSVGVRDDVRASASGVRESERRHPEMHPEEMERARAMGGVLEDPMIDLKVKKFPADATDGRRKGKSKVVRSLAHLDADFHHRAYELREKGVYVVSLIGDQFNDVVRDDESERSNNSGLGQGVQFRDMGAQLHAWDKFPLDAPVVFGIPTWRKGFDDRGEERNAMNDMPLDEFELMIFERLSRLELRIEEMKNKGIEVVIVVPSGRDFQHSLGSGGANLAPARLEVINRQLAEFTKRTQSGEVKFAGDPTHSLSDNFSPLRPGSEGKGLVSGNVVFVGQKRFREAGDLGRDGTRDVTSAGGAAESAIVFTLFSDQEANLQSPRTAEVEGAASHLGRGDGTFASDGDDRTAFGIPTYRKSDRDDSNVFATMSADDYREVIRPYFEAMAERAKGVYLTGRDVIVTIPLSGGGKINLGRGAAGLPDSHLDVIDEMVEQYRQRFYCVHMVVLGNDVKAVDARDGIKAEVERIRKEQAETYPHVFQFGCGFSARGVDTSHRDFEYTADIDEDANAGLRVLRELAATLPYVGEFIVPLDGKRIAKLSFLDSNFSLVVEDRETHEVTVETAVTRLEERVFVSGSKAEFKGFVAFCESNRTVIIAAAEQRRDDMREQHGAVTEGLWDILDADSAGLDVMLRFPVKAGLDKYQFSLEKRPKEGILVIGWKGREYRFDRKAETFNMPAGEMEEMLDVVRENESMVKKAYAAEADRNSRLCGILRGLPDGEMTLRDDVFGEVKLSHTLPEDKWRLTWKNGAAVEHYSIDLTSGDVYGRYSYHPDGVPLGEVLDMVVDNGDRIRDHIVRDSNRRTVLQREVCSACRNVGDEFTKGKFKFCKQRSGSIVVTHDDYKHGELGVFDQHYGKINYNYSVGGNQELISRFEAELATSDVLVVVGVVGEGVTERQPRRDMAKNGDCFLQRDDGVMMISRGGEVVCYMEDSENPGYVKSYVMLDGVGLVPELQCAPVTRTDVMLHWRNLKEEASLLLEDVEALELEDVVLADPAPAPAPTFAASMSPERIVATGFPRGSGADDCIKRLDFSDNGFERSENADGSVISYSRGVGGVDIVFKFETASGFAQMVVGGRGIMGDKMSMHNVGVDKIKTWFNQKMRGTADSYGVVGDNLRTVTDVVNNLFNSDRSRSGARGDE